MAKMDTTRVDAIHDKWIDLESRQMWIHGIDVSGPEYEGEEPGVEYMMATKVIKNLLALKEASTEDRVIIHMQTIGGEYDHGMAIYDVIKSMPYHVTIIAYAFARSMSSIILQAADRRVMMPNCYFMFHWGDLTLSDTANAVISQVKFAELNDKTMIRIYTDAAMEGERFKGKVRESVTRTISDAMNKKGDVFLDAPATVDWGFADEIFCDWDKI